MRLFAVIGLMFLLALATAPTSAQTWTAPGALSDAGQNAFQPQLAVEP